MTSSPKWIQFERELQALINSHSLENLCGDTPDWILADHCVASLKVFANTTDRRSKWYGKAEDDPLVPNSWRAA